MGEFVYDAFAAQGIETTFDDSVCDNVQLARDRNGKILPTMDNFLKIMRSDSYFSSARRNLLTGRDETDADGYTRSWSDVDDARAMAYIEQKYAIYNRDKFSGALNACLDERRYHPVRDRLNGVEWDGVGRIDDCLIKWLKCDDTPYIRECSRLIFAGGIHRLYNPGCKFDDMIVLVGTRQGEGKSTFVRWLAMQDNWFAEVTSFGGKEAVEELQGAWICEVGELLAMTRQKDVEGVKAFLTRTVDRCRMAYDRRISEHPRQCVFIGTTNKREFLTDKTGNRRFYPVMVNSSGYDLLAHEAECRAYIEQCWAEAKAKIDTKYMQPFADRQLIASIREEQATASNDDWRIGAIQRYIETRVVGAYICRIELWENALHPGDFDNARMDRRDESEIGEIMDRIDGLKRAGKSRLHGLKDKYGPQNCWKKVKHVKFCVDE